MSCRASRYNRWRWSLFLVVLACMSSWAHARSAPGASAGTHTPALARTAEELAAVIARGSASVLITKHLDLTGAETLWPRKSTEIIQGDCVDESLPFAPMTPALLPIDGPQCVIIHSLRLFNFAVANSTVYVAQLYLRMHGGASGTAIELRGLGMRAYLEGIVFQGGEAMAARAMLIQPGVAAYVHDSLFADLHVDAASPPTPCVEVNHLASLALNACSFARISARERSAAVLLVRPASVRVTSCSFSDLEVPALDAWCDALGASDPELDVWKCDQNNVYVDASVTPHIGAQLNHTNTPWNSPATAPFGLFLSGDDDWLQELKAANDISPVAAPPGNAAPPEVDVPAGDLGGGQNAIPVAAILIWVSVLLILGTALMLCWYGWSRLRRRPLQPMATVAAHPSWKPPGSNAQETTLAREPGPSAQQSHLTGTDIIVSGVPSHDSPAALGASTQSYHGEAVSTPAAPEAKDSDALLPPPAAHNPHASGAPAHVPTDSSGSGSAAHAPPPLRQPSGPAAPEAVTDPILAALVSPQRRTEAARPNSAGEFTRNTFTPSLQPQDALACTACLQTAAVSCGTGCGAQPGAGRRASEERARGSSPVVGVGLDHIHNPFAGTRSEYSPAAPVRPVGDGWVPDAVTAENLRGPSFRRVATQDQPAAGVHSEEPIESAFAEVPPDSPMSPVLLPCRAAQCVSGSVSVGFGPGTPETAAGRVFDAGGRGAPAVARGGEPGGDSQRPAMATEESLFPPGTPGVPALFCSTSIPPPSADPSRASSISGKGNSDYTMLPAPPMAGTPCSPQLHSVFASWKEDKREQLLAEAAAGVAHETPLERALLCRRLSQMADSGQLLFDKFYVNPGSEERREGGQSVVQFVTPRKLQRGSASYAAKFFLSRAAFEREKLVFADRRLQDGLFGHPQVYDDAEDPALAGPSTPFPLPPCIIVERGTGLMSFRHTGDTDRDTVVNLLAKLSEQLKVLHDAGWAHRDIKPQNMIHAPGSFGWALIDFGCAARIGEKSPSYFSWRFVAPETLEAAAEDGWVTVTAAVDVWAFGVLCLEMLGLPVFNSNSHVIACLLDGVELPWEAEEERERLRSGLKGMHAVVLQCLEREPSKRPSSAQLYNVFHALALGSVDIDRSPLDGGCSRDTHEFNA